MSLDLPHDFDEHEDAPDWKAGGRVHNWRNHVGPAMRALWPELDVFAREAMASDAQARADAEEWD